MPTAVQAYLHVSDVFEMAGNVFLEAPTGVADGSAKARSAITRPPANRRHSQRYIMILRQIPPTQRVRLCRLTDIILGRMSQ